MNGKQKGLWIKNIITVLAIITVFGYTATKVYALGESNLMQSIVSGEQIDLYISNLDIFTEAEGQIGREAVEIVGMEDNVPGRTIFLIDNSKSVSEKNIEKMKEIISLYLEHKLPEEKVSIAIFGETVEEYLITDESDSSKIKEVFESITVKDKETYLTDALYDELLEYQTTDIYTRFIILSDGVDNKSLGYTKEELSELLKEYPFPIFSIGCRNNSNEENLKNMFALSRMTDGNYYLLDDYETYEEVISGLTEQISCVSISIPESLKDGSIQNILLRFHTSTGIMEVKDEIAMPFSIRETVEEPEIEEKPVEEDNVVDEPVVVPIETSEEIEIIEEEIEEKSGIDIISLISVVLVVSAIVFLIINTVRKKKSKKGKSGKVTSDCITNHVISNDSEEMEEKGTVFLEEEQTVYLGGINDAECKILVVRDANQPERTFRYPLRGRVIIGRKKDFDTCSDVNIVINYDTSVSARHLAVTMHGEQLFVEDLNSSNGTFINGERIRGIVPVSVGSMIKIGRVPIILETE